MHALMRKRLRREYAFLLEELIGRELEVRKASSRGLQGLEGRIIDESRNTFLLETAGGRKRIPKAGSTFSISPPGLPVEGKMLLMRPEDRTKKLAREFI